jgi:hypothetical protein
MTRTERTGNHIRYLRRGQEENGWYAPFGQKGDVGDVPMSGTDKKEYAYFPAVKSAQI